ncbi:MAG TPA: M28 family peptidase, partial [Vicinamibacterales bacterium]|nr:M28 family peptidase [Vicinamibacterales bacterium]
MRPTRRLLFTGALLLAALIAHAGAQPARVDPAQLMRDVEVLAADEMEGRLVGTPGSARARAYIVRRFREAGIRPTGASYEHLFTLKRTGRAGSQQGVNVLAVVRGARTPGRYLVVTAHYDHLGVRDGRVYNGANDN